MIIQKINEFLHSYQGNYLEIGVYYGETFFEVAKDNPSKTVYGIDPFIADGWTGQKRGSVLSEPEQICNQKIKEFSNAVLIKQTSKKFYQQLTDPNRWNVSVVFIDGSHWLEDVRIDTEIAMKLIGSKRGLIIYDDLHIADVRTAIGDAKTKYYNHLTPIPDPKTLRGLGGWFIVN